AGLVAVMMVGSAALCIGLVRLERLTAGGRFGDPDEGADRRAGPLSEMSRYAGEPPPAGPWTARG
ncbi:MAG: hypothetical protein ABR559_10415, partial [Gemmatimonadota bacterium]